MKVVPQSLDSSDTRCDWVSWVQPTGYYNVTYYIHKEWDLVYYSDGTTESQNYKYSSRTVVGSTCGGGGGGGEILPPTPPSGGELSYAPPYPSSVLQKGATPVTATLTWTSGDGDWTVTFHFYKCKEQTNTTTCTKSGGDLFTSTKTGTGVADKTISATSDGYKYPKPGHYGITAELTQTGTTISRSTDVWVTDISSGR
ncbi:MAG: hypothetical protein IRY83_15590 [Chloroflexi bacterium]|nr:hypothetical protein [Chloroflexota bacterium]